MYTPGDLNKRIEVMELGSVSDGSGGFEEALTPVKKLWAGILPVSGREFWQAQQKDVEISHKIVLRFTNDINRTHVIKYGSRQFDIQYIINVDEKSRFLELQVLEKQ